MTEAVQYKCTSYLQFNRKQWASLHNFVPLKLTETEITNLQDINESISIKEVMEIYLPLSYLLNFYIRLNLNHQAVLKRFSNTGSSQQCIPYIIGITGGVAVGKSTIARVLQELLRCYSKNRTVELVTTDSFLHPNRVLKERNLMKKKGFPQSYDTHSLVSFILKIKSGVPQVTAPIYSHLSYDIIPDSKKVISQPDILILEGLNVLQNNREYHQYDPCHIFVSDFIDFSIYIDASEDLLQHWYINRFLKFRQKAFYDYNSYFYHYTKLSEQEAVNIASEIWVEINGLNLQKNILPTRERANLILGKSTNHMVDRVQLKNNTKIIAKK